MQCAERVSVLSKTPCLFKIEITEKESTKTERRGCQQVLASSEISEDARRLLDDECTARASGKVDGTCTLFRRNDEGEVFLMMRQDLRISTSGKHVGKYVTKKGKPSSVPEGWVSFLERLKRLAGSVPITLAFALRIELRTSGGLMLYWRTGPRRGF
jgi:hypothetical protein